MKRKKRQVGAAGAGVVRAPRAPVVVSLQSCTLPARATIDRDGNWATNRFTKRKAHQIGFHGWGNLERCYQWTLEGSVECT